MSVKSRTLATLAAVLVVVLLVTNLPAGRVAMALAVCLLLPGLGWARKMHFGDLGDTVALAVVLSVCTTIAVGTAMALSDHWSVGWGLLVLAGVTLAGFVPGQLLAGRTIAAVRSGFGDDGGALADWYRETQQQALLRRARSGVAASEASAVWVDWYADVKRRTAEAREREAAAQQDAVDQWISWYQQTQLMTTRREPGGD